MAGGVARALPSWLESDTWFRVGTGALTWWNARTGVHQAHPPTGLRADGERAGAAASTGPWAVPPAADERPPPHLRMEPPREEVDLLTPVFERWGSGPLFTAPHGVNVSRDGCADHLPEDFTTFLARTWAADTAGCSVVWSSAALALCAATEAPVPGARDPNYLLAAEAAGNPWVSALSGISGHGAEAWTGSVAAFHVDIHGKSRREGEGDLDVGVGAIQAVHGGDAAGAVADCVQRALQRALPGHVVDGSPRLQGCWRSVPRRTLTQSAVDLGFVSIQLELGYHLRRDISRDRELSARVGASAAAQRACHALAMRRAPPLTEHPRFSQRLPSLTSLPVPSVRAAALGACSEADISDKVKDYRTRERRAAPRIIQIQLSQTANSQRNTVTRAGRPRSRSRADGGNNGTRDV